MCVEVIVCYIIVVFLRHGVFCCHVMPCTSKIGYKQTGCLQAVWDRCCVGWWGTTHGGADAGRRVDDTPVFTPALTRTGELISAVCRSCCSRLTTSAVHRHTYKLYKSQLMQVDPHSDISHPSCCTQSECDQQVTVAVICWRHLATSTTSNRPQWVQGCSNGGVYQYIYLQKSVYLTNFY